MFQKSGEGTKMNDSVIAKIHIFLDIYENTFGQLPKHIKLSAEDLRTYHKEIMSPHMFRTLSKEELNHYRGVELRMDTKEIEEKNKKELEELRKLKESLENIKSVLKV